MAIMLVAVGQKWTATIANAIIALLNAMGRTAVTPTSVAGTGVSLSGSKVVVSAATSVSVNGCFSATYEWYDIYFDLTLSGAGHIEAVLRLSGTDATSGYDRQTIGTANATSTPGQALNQSTWRVTTTDFAGRHSGTVRLFAPAVAVQTTGTLYTGGSANPMTSSSGALYQGFISHRTTTVYDGFTFTPSTGNLTGTIRIQGIS